MANPNGDPGSLAGDQGLEAKQYGAADVLGELATEAGLSAASAEQPAAEIDPSQLSGRSHKLNESWAIQGQHPGWLGFSSTTGLPK